MWVVRCGDQLYVRSAGGPERKWYRDAIVSGEGRLRFGLDGQCRLPMTSGPNPEPPRDVPDPLTEELHGRRQEHNANDGGVDEYGRRQRDA
jgi:hypothetical protein